MANQKIPQPLKAKPRFFYGYIMVAAALFIMTVMFGTYNTFGIFLKPISTEFDWTRAMTSGAFSLSMLVYGLLGIVMGGLTDRLGPRTVLTLCGFLSGLGYLLLSQVNDIWQLYLFYGVIVGAGLSGAFIPQMSMIARWFVKRRSMMTGIATAGLGVGTLAMPPIANLLIATYGWRMSYIILGGIVLIVAILAAQALKRAPSQMGQAPYGASEGESPALKPEADSIPFREVVYTRQFWLACSLAFCSGLCTLAAVVHIAPHATDMGASATAAANIMAVIGGMGIAGRVLLGSAADRIGNKQTFIISFILMAASLLWLVPAREIWTLYLFAAIFGFAQSGLGALLSPLLAELFGLSSHGLFMGLTMLGFALGGAIGPFAAGYLFDATSSYQAAFLALGIIAIIGIVLTALITPTRLDKRHSTGL